MKKGLIITGGPQSGKTTKAFEKAKEYKESDVVRINIKDHPFYKNDDYLFRDCTLETKLIIVDEITCLEDIIEFWMPLVTKPICVNIKYKPLFLIKPQIILITPKTKEELFAYFGLNKYLINSRFDFMECKKA